MKVSLKLARRIETAIAEIIGTRVNSLRTSVGLFNHVTPAKQAAEEAHSRVHKEVVGLVNLRYTLRQRIAVANEASGVNRLIGEVSHLEALVGTLKALSAPVLAEVRTEAVSAYARNEQVTYRAPLDKVITDLKFQVSASKDRIAGINAQTTIELTDSEVAVLKELGIPV